LIILGNSTEFSLRKASSLPSQYSLSQNYPNPFNPVTFITYTVLEMSYIEILIYNLAGQAINELVSEMKASGQYSISWDGTDNLGNPVASGVYFYSFHGNRFSDMKKMILMK
jgi:flagellar hook assembly protein FlgD